MESEKRWLCQTAPKSRSRAGVEMLGVAALWLCACSPSPSDPGADTETVRSALTTSSSISRVIPIQFIQFYASGGSPIPTSTFQVRVDELNAAYASAGVQFFIKGVASHAGTGFEVTGTPIGGDCNNGENFNHFTWPDNPSAAWPTMDLNCSGSASMPSTPYGALIASLGAGNRVDTMDGPWGALWRAPAYCAPDGVVVDYIVDNRGCQANQGAVPGDGNSILEWAGDVSEPANSGTSNIVHEMGHYLGGLGDLSPSSAAALEAAGNWDLLWYSATNRFFSSKADLQTWRSANPSAVLSKIETNVNYCSATTTCLSGCNCPASCPPNGTTPRNDTGDIKVTLGSTTYYTGASQLQGLAAISGSTHFVNTMSYSNWCYQGVINRTNLKDFLSPSDIEHVRGVLNSNTDLPLSNSGTPPNGFPGATSRRNRLGVGEGFWTEWTQIGAYAASRPGIDVASGHAFITWRLTPPGGNAIAEADCTTTQTGTCAVTSVSSSTQALEGRSDIALAGSGSSISAHVIALGSPNGNPVHGAKPKSGGTWSSATAWGYPGGNFLEGLSVTGRSSGQIDIIGRGLDSNAWIGTLNADGSWPAGTSYQNIGGTFSGPISIATRADGTTIDVVARQGGSILHRSRTGAGTWSSWTTLMTGTSVSDPALSERPDGQVDVVAVVDSNVCFESLSSGTWFAGPCVATSGTIWGNPGLSIVGVPAVSSWGLQRLDFVARTSDGSIAYRFLKSDGTWWPSTTGWANLGSSGSWSEGDPIMVAPGTNNLAIFRVDGSGNLYYRTRYQ